MISFGGFIWGGERWVSDGWCRERDCSGCCLLPYVFSLLDMMRERWLTC